MGALLSKTERLTLEKTEQEDSQPGLIRLPAEIRNTIYEMCTSPRPSYTIQYPRSSGISDLQPGNVFHLNRQTRDEALSLLYNGSFIKVEPRPGFYTVGLPRALTRLPTDVIKYCSEIEIHAAVKPPFGWLGGPNSSRVELSFVVDSEGVYYTKAYYFRAQGVDLLPWEVERLTAYIEGLIEELEGLMVKALAGKKLEKEADGRRIRIVLINTSGMSQVFGQW